MSGASSATKNSVDTRIVRQAFQVTSVDASIHGPWRQPRKDPGAPLFRNFANKLANLLRLGKKKKQVSLFCAQLFVTLHPN
jgi:hypothetical protein